MGIRQYQQDDARQASASDQIVTRFGRLHILDDLIRLRAEDLVQHPILAYPKPSNKDSASYEYFTGQDLDCMIDQVVCTLMDCGFKPVRSLFFFLLSISVLTM